MAPCLTVAAAFWCETVAWPVCFYSSVCGEMGSPRAEPDSQNGCCVYRQLADSVHRGMCVSVCGVKNRALTCHNLWFLKQERKRRSVWVMESGCLCSVCNYGSLCGPFLFFVNKMPSHGQDCALSFSNYLKTFHMVRKSSFITWKLQGFVLLWGSQRSGQADCSF